MIPSSHHNVCFCQYKPIPFLLFTVAVAKRVKKLPVVVIQTFCYHGNMTSHFSSQHICSVSPVPLGSIPELPAETCKEVKASEEQAVSGKYWLYTIKESIPVLAHCNMETFGKFETALKIHLETHCKGFLFLTVDI